MTQEVTVWYTYEVDADNPEEAKSAAVQNFYENVTPVECDHSLGECTYTDLGPWPKT